jgi:hypothetical protein
MSPETLSIVSLIVTVIGAAAACIAAYFSWQAPSKKDLARVEEHTAATSEHLQVQRLQAELERRTSQVSIAVQARNPSTEELNITLTVQDLSIMLISIELLSETLSSFGKFPCLKLRDEVFSTVISPHVIHKWYFAGTVTQGAIHMLSLRVYMLIGADQTHRLVPVGVSLCKIPEPDCHYPARDGWLIEGQV